MDIESCAEPTAADCARHKKAFLSRRIIVCTVPTIKKVGSGSCKCIYCSRSASGRLLRSAIATLFSYTIPSLPLIRGPTLSFCCRRHQSLSIVVCSTSFHFILFSFFDFFEANLINNPFAIRNTHFQRIFPTAVDQISSHTSKVISQLPSILISA